MVEFGIGIGGREHCRRSATHETDEMPGCKVSVSPPEREAEATWTRLRRRKVVQWGLVYVAAAWGFLQGLEYISDAFNWPQQVRQIAVLALVIGLPIVLVLAWYHGDRGEQRISTHRVRDPRAAPAARRRGPSGTTSAQTKLRHGGAGGRTCCATRRGDARARREINRRAPIRGHVAAERSGVHVRRHRGGTAQPARAGSRP